MAGEENEDIPSNGGIAPPEEQLNQNTKGKQEETTETGSPPKSGKESRPRSSGGNGGSVAAPTPSVGGTTSGGFSSSTNRVSTEDSDVLDPFYDFGPQEPQDYTTTTTENGVDNQTPSSGEGIINVVLCRNGIPVRANILGSMGGALL